MSNVYSVLAQENLAKWTSIILETKERYGIDTPMEIRVDDEKIYLESFGRLTEITNDNTIKGAENLGSLEGPEETILLASLANSLLNRYKDAIPTLGIGKIEGTLEFDYPSSISFNENNFVQDFLHIPKNDQLDSRTTELKPTKKAVSEKAIKKYFPSLDYNPEHIQAFCAFVNKKL